MGFWGVRETYFASAGWEQLTACTGKDHMPLFLPDSPHTEARTSMASPDGRKGDK